MSPVFEQPECVHGNYAHNKERTQSLKERNLSLSVFVVTEYVHYDTPRIPGGSRRPGASDWGKPSPRGQFVAVLNSLGPHLGRPTNSGRQRIILQTAEIGRPIRLIG